MYVASFHIEEKYINQIERIHATSGAPKSLIVRNAIESFCSNSPFRLKDYVRWTALQAQNKKEDKLQKRQVSFSIGPSNKDFLQRVSRAFGCSQSRLLCFILDTYTGVI